MLSILLFRITAVCLMLLPFVRVTLFSGHAGRATTTALVVAGGTAIGGAALVTALKGVGVLEGIRGILGLRPVPPPDPFPKPTKTAKEPRFEPNAREIQSAPGTPRELELPPELEAALTESVLKTTWQDSLNDAVQREEVLLYDSAGRAIVTRDSARRSMEQKYRRLVQRILADAIDKATPIPKDRGRLKKLLAGILILQPRFEYDFETNTGKLTLTFKTTLGEITGQINVYDVVDRTGPPTRPEGARATIERKDSQDRKRNPFEEQ